MTKKISKNFYKINFETNDIQYPDFMKNLENPNLKQQTKNKK